MTASSGTPSPVINMPVWPVARKLLFMPRLRINSSIAIAVYILPTEQSVPTARHLLPLRFFPLAIGYSTDGTRTSCSLRPLAAASSTKSGSSRSRLCNPLAKSKPMRKASISTCFQAAEITPPRLATPITSVLAPASNASCRDRSSSPRSAPQWGNRNWPTAFSGRQSLIPCATFADN